MLDREPQPCSLLIFGAHILTSEPGTPDWADGAIAIRDGRIVAIGPSRALLGRFAPHERVDAAGGVLHAGFIDAHVHVSQYSARTVLGVVRAGAAMGEWKAALTAEDEHASALLAAADYLRAGYTGFVDPGTVFEPDAVAAVADQAGIRIWLADPYVADQAHQLADREPDLASPGFLARWPASLDAALQRLGGQLARNTDPDTLARGHLALYGEGTASGALQAAAAHLARTAGASLSQHIGYNPTTFRAEAATAGCSSFEALSTAGLLGPWSSFTHVNVLRPAEIGLLRRAEAKLIWAPWGQAQAFGRGGAEPRMVEAVRAGVAVGLATDIPRMINVDGLGSLAMAVGAAVGQAPTAREVLGMRTLGAARTVGADRELGSIVVGKQADLVLRRQGMPAAFGFDHALEAAVLGGPVTHVWIGGRRVLDDAGPVRFDKDAAAIQAHASAQRIAGRIGLSAPSR